MMRAMSARSIALPGALALVTLAGALASCGGSGSDTPWPAEPESAPPGPLGEGSPGFDLEDGGAPIQSARAAPVPVPASTERPPLR